MYKKIKKLFIILHLFLFIVIVHAAHASADFKNPRIGIVISKTSFDHKWGVTQMAAHGWAAIVNLAGIPYDCLFTEDIVASDDLSKYSSLVFAQGTYIENALYAGLIRALKQYVHHGGNIIVDGPLGIYDEDARERDHNELDDLLGLVHKGFRGGPTYRIKISDDRHYITRLFEPGQFVTQHIASGLRILDFREDGQSLLSVSNEEISYPFLSARKSGKNRIILVSDLSTWSGVASFFRNNEPQGFYPNRIFEVLVRAVHWSVYGHTAQPFPVPQVSNAQLTSIVRLDADESYDPDAQEKTIDYLVSLAKETGVVALYGWVSSLAGKAGWETLAPLGKKLEDAGGQIGSHSKFHQINNRLDEAIALTELDGSIEEIEFNMIKHNSNIGRVEHFINPGKTISMDDYGLIAQRFSFYMTHGFEEAMPLGYGNMTWYTGHYRDLVVLDSTPAQDYQWLYYPKWSYSTAEAAAYQEAIFDHMYHNIGRGVIFNQMWHDYAIVSMPVEPDRSYFEKLFSGERRIMNKSNRALYDALKTKFASHNIYCPDPVDLGNKLRAMAQWDYAWKSDGNRIDMQLDLSGVQLKTLAGYTGGMGIRIENSGKKVQNVTINGRPHYAFSDQVIILPNLEKKNNRIEVTLGDDSSRQPRLTFVSKRMPSIHKHKDGLAVTLLTKSKAKFSFYTQAPFILLHADRQEWDGNGDEVLKGYVTSDRTVLLKKTGTSDFVISRATIPIIEYEEADSGITLTLGKSDATQNSIWFRSGTQPRKAMLNRDAVEINRLGKNFRLTLPAYDQSSKLTITF